MSTSVTVTTQQLSKIKEKRKQKTSQLLICPPRRAGADATVTGWSSLFTFLVNFYSTMAERELAFFNKTIVVGATYV